MPVALLPLARVCGGNSAPGALRGLGVPRSAPGRLRDDPMRVAQSALSQVCRPGPSGYRGAVAQRTSTVVLMCGLPGAGKTTYARELVLRGYVRLSIDEAVWQRLGHRDAGLVLEPEAFDRLKEEVRAEQRRELVELMRAGRDVVVDYSFWSRAARDDYKALIERHGCRWELVHLKTDRATLERRLQARNGESGANSVTVDATLLNRYLAAFEEPEGEGEQVVGPSPA